MSDSPGEQNTLRRSQRVRTNLGLPPIDARTEDTPRRRRRSSSSREPEDRTVVAVNETNNRRMQPVSEGSEDNDSPFNDTFVRNEASRINARAGSTNRRDPNHFDPGEMSDRASRYDSAEIYLRDCDPITLKMKHQLYVIRLPESKKGRLGQ